MKRLFILFVSMYFFNAAAQDISFARKMVDTLSSSYFWGRGYTNEGMKKAADFIAGQFKSFGLEPLDNKSFFQKFSYPVNTFPGKMEVAVNGRELVAGKDFIVAPEAHGLKAEGTLEEKDSADFVDTKNRFIIHLADKLTWSVSPEAADYTLIDVDKKAIDKIPSQFKVDIDNRFISSFKVANICSYVKGTTSPDSFIFITPHYDHLGGMGRNTYFPGG